jgi:hypothetical protein
MTVTAVDSDGVEASITLLLRDAPPDYPSGFISGPPRVPVGEEATYTFHPVAEVPNQQNLSWLLFPVTAMTGSKTERTMAWSEPGTARIVVKYESPEGTYKLDEFVVGVHGEAAPVAARFFGEPTNLTIGAPATWLVQGMGGNVAPPEGFRGYLADIDWGNGESVSGIELEARSAAEWSTVAEVPYAYEEAGEYTVTLTVTDAEGTSAEATSTVTVTDRIVAVGEFWHPDPEDYPFYYEVTQNRIRIVVDAGEVRIPRFEFSSISVPWAEFDLESGETTESTCARHSDSTLGSFQGAFDPATGRITGTGEVTTHRVDIGTNCPFGGIDVIDTYPFELTATLADGMIEGSFQYVDSEGALTFEAVVRDE